ncbi:MAG: hypothetical protein QXG39_02500 [Candidatus Aenigmatarchaeota archaeon]
MPIVLNRWTWKEWIYNIISLLFIIGLLWQVIIMKKQCESFNRSVYCYYENQIYIEEKLRNLNFTYGNVSLSYCVCNISFLIST